MNIEGGLGGGQKPYPIPFGYSNILKTAYKQGNLPSVKVDFYGSRLTPKIATLDHVKPKAAGGKSCLSNYVLATFNNNNVRGTRDINEVATKPNAIKYFMQFKDIIVKRFNGNEYIKMATRNLKNLGFDITKEINELLKQ